MPPAKASRAQRLTPNQIVAQNLRRARQRLGLTQEQAAERLQPFLGGEAWSKATWSAAEASRDPGAERIRQFDADEIVAFARAFELPVAWFFMPQGEGAMVSPSRAESPPLSDAELRDLAYDVTSEALQDRIRETIHDEQERTEWLELARVQIGRAFVQAVMARSGGKLSEEARRMRRLADDLEALEREAGALLSTGLTAGPSSKPSSTARRGRRPARGKGKP